VYEIEPKYGLYPTMIKWLSKLIANLRKKRKYSSYYLRYQPFESCSFKKNIFDFQFIKTICLVLNKSFPGGKVAVSMFLTAYKASRPPLPFLQSYYIDNKKTYSQGPSVFPSTFFLNLYNGHVSFRFSIANTVRGSVEIFGHETMTKCRVLVCELTRWNYPVVNSFES